MIKEIPIFSKVCMQFHFKFTMNQITETDSIIFVKPDQIFEFNFKTEEVKTLLKFKIEFDQ